MIVLQGKGLAKRFGSRVLFENVEFQLDEGDRAGLIGNNGVGKTTLLRILLGEETQDAGVFSIARGVRVGYLSQHLQVDLERTMRAEAATAFADVTAMGEELERLAHAMAETSGPEQAALLEKYHDLQAMFERRGGYTIGVEIEKVLHGLGFTDADLERRVRELSGGQKNRVALAKLIVTRPEFLVLDEPTNYLDLQATEWLEEYLLTYPGSVLVVSHDRYFLDRVCTHIWEMERGVLRDYRANYSKSRLVKAELMESHRRAFKNQQNFIAKEEEFIRRHIAGQRTREAQGRRKKLENIDRLEAWEEDDREMRLMIKPAERGGNLVLECQDMSVEFPGKPIVRKLSMDVLRGDKIGIIGPNGAGKTTLLRTWMGTNKHSAGVFRWGQGLRIEYYDQELRDLEPSRTVFQEVFTVATGLKAEKVKTFLGNFLFSGQDQDKLISALSGGERARVVLAKILLQRPNVILMDEPTNHLDIGARECLEEALQEYEGTLIIVSHDRFFLDSVATKILHLADAKAKLYTGNYTAYREQSTRKAPVIKPDRESEKPVDEKSIKSEVWDRIKFLRRAVEKMERKIHDLEARVDEVRKTLELPEVYMDHQKAATISAEIRGYEQQLAEWYRQWEKDQLELDMLKDKCRL